jgi:hypothetical protein
VESVFFGSRGGVNTALVYLSANDAFGPRSKAMGFHADASAFGGFQLTPQKAGAGACLCTVGDNSTGAMRPGLYAVLVGSGRLPRAEDFMFSGYVDRPLVALSGRAPSVDYLAFGIGA